MSHPSGMVRTARLLVQDAGKLFRAATPPEGWDGFATTNSESGVSPSLHEVANRSTHMLSVGGWDYAESEAARAARFGTGSHLRLR